MENQRTNRINGKLREWDEVGPLPLFFKFSSSVGATLGGALKEK